MTDQNTEHPTSERRRYKSPPVLHDTDSVPVPRLADHLDTESDPSDGDGEKEAKRQRSEPTTPVSTSSRPPYEYDAVMGITRVGTKEAERFDEGSDLVYHDASEEPPQQEPQDRPEATRDSGVHHRGCGSSSLRECIEFLNNTVCKAPATLHSGIEHPKLTDLQQVMSPNVEESPTAEGARPSGLATFDTSLVKDEPQTRVQPMKREVVTTDVKTPTLDVKEELSEPEVKEENTADPVGKRHRRTALHFLIRKIR